MINVVGLGYIGLPTALMMAAHGNRVVGTDINAVRIKSLKAGILPFEEDGLEELFDNGKENMTYAHECVAGADYYIITVPTPYDNVTKRIDASYVVKGVEDVLAVIDEGGVIIVESTISPGTIDKFVRPVVEKSKKNVHLVHCPERIIPGKLVSELITNSRTIGADAPEIANRVRDIYRTFCQGEVICTDIRTAEMTKVIENTSRAISIAFANEIVKICHANGMDAHEIIRISNHHPRVKILNPGPGVGGHCIPVDPWFLVGDYPTLTNLIRAAMDVNASMPGYVLERIHEIMRERGMSDVSRVGFYGLTYKEDVDDVRESPTLQLIEEVERSLGNTPKCFDPMLRNKIVTTQYDDFDTFLKAVDFVVIMVGHRHLKENVERLKGKVVLDTRKVCGLDECYVL